jgi:hypothetical protein
MPAVIPIAIGLGAFSGGAALAKKKARSASGPNPAATAAAAEQATPDAAAMSNTPLQSDAEMLARAASIRRRRTPGGGLSGGVAGIMGALPKRRRLGFGSALAYQAKSLIGGGA